MALGTAGLVALGIGGASVLGGIGAGISAAKQKTDPRKVQYGGTPEELEALQAQAAGGLAQGNQGYTSGVSGLRQSANDGRGIMGLGQGLINQANTFSGVQAQNAGGQILAGYQPGQVSAMQSRATIDQNNASNLGAARSGGALGLRNALTANAQAGVQAAQNASVLRAQEQQQYVQAQVAQANQNQQDQFQAQQQTQAQRAQLYGLGGGLMTSGNGQAQSAYGNIAQAGLSNQGQFMDQQTHLLDADNQNKMTYEQIRQANQARKSDRKWGLASGLISGGMSAMTGALK